MTLSATSPPAGPAFATASATIAAIVSPSSVGIDSSWAYSRSAAKRISVASTTASGIPFASKVKYKESDTKQQPAQSAERLTCFETVDANAAGLILLVGQ